MPPPHVDTLPAWQPRAAAALTTLALGAWLAGGPAWLLLLLLPDFVARAWDRRQLAPLGRLLGALGPRVLPAAWRAPRTYWPPKRFAARMGLAMLLAIVGASWAGAPLTARALASLMGGLGALEAGLGLCVACSLYTLGGRLGVVRACPDGRCTFAPSSR